MRGCYRLDAVWVLDQFYRQKIAFLEEGYNNIFFRNSYSPRERALLVSLVRGTVKMRPHIERLLRLYLPRWEKLPLTVQNLFQLAVFQLLFHSGIPIFATVNEWVEVAKSLAGGKFVALVNAVLRKIGRNPETYREEASAWDMALPDWLENEWIVLFPQEKEKIKKSLVSPPKTWIRVNALRIEREELKDRLETRGIGSEENPLFPFALQVSADFSRLLRIPEWQEGLFYPQDFGSQFAAELLCPREGERVVDLCCGVGGKSMLFAQIMHDRGEIFAWDYRSEKITILNNFLRRMKIESIRPSVVDVLHPPHGFLESADRVFLDAPCSGFGTLRRNPEIRERVQQKEIQMLAKNQLDLLWSASFLVKRGGIILYCVCTMTIEETRGVIFQFEQTSGEKFERASWEEMGISQKKLFLLQKTDFGGVFILPNIFKNDGFFVMAWKRK